MSHPLDPHPWPVDPTHRCTSRNGSLRCVLRPHAIGFHLGLDPEGSKLAVPSLWDREDRVGVTVAPQAAQDPPRPPPAPAPNPTLVPFRYEGDACEACGMLALVRTGKCTTCQNCGNSGGCG